MSLHEGTGDVGFAPVSPGAASAVELPPGMMRHAGWVLEVLHEDRDAGGASKPGTAFPQGSVAPRARAGSDPTAPGGECNKHSITGQFFDKKREVAPSPDIDPE